MNGRIAERLTHYLLADNENKLTYMKVNYFIKMLLSESEKGIVIISFFGALGYIKEIMIIYLIVISLRRYCGGHHCTTFIGCLIASLFFCGIAIYGSKYLRINKYAGIIFVLVHIILILFAIPIKSITRPRLFKRDVKKIRFKAMIGMVIIVTLCMCLSNDTVQVIKMTLFLLFIDEVYAGFQNGFTIILRGGGDNEKRDSTTN